MKCTHCTNSRFCEKAQEIKCHYNLSPLRNRAGRLFCSRFEREPGIDDDRGEAYGLDFEGGHYHVLRSGVY